MTTEGFEPFYGCNHLRKSHIVPSLPSGLLHYVSRFWLYYPKRIKYPTLIPLFSPDFRTELMTKTSTHLRWNGFQLRMPPRRFEPLSVWKPNKLGIGLEPKYTYLLSKESISIPNWSNFPLCSKRKDDKNRSTGISSDFCGRKRTCSESPSPWFWVYKPSRGV